MLDSDQRCGLHNIYVVVWPVFEPESIKITGFRSKKTRNGDVRFAPSCLVVEPAPFRMTKAFLRFGKIVRQRMKPL